MTKDSGDVVDLTPPAEEDLAALRATLFQEGEDDTGRIVPGTQENSFWSQPEYPVHS